MPQFGQVGWRGSPQLPQNLSKGTLCQLQFGHQELIAPSMPSCEPQYLHCLVSAVFSFRQTGQMKFFCIAIYRNIKYFKPVFLHKQFDLFQVYQYINYQNYRETYTVVWMMLLLKYQIACRGL